MTHLRSTLQMLSSDDMPAGVAARKDYNAEGRKLIASFGLTPASSEYNDKDPIYKDPATGGCIYVGNEIAARGPTNKLLEAGITHVVSCTDDMANFCEVPVTHAPHPKANEPRITYLRFNVAYWQGAGTLAPHPAGPQQIVDFPQDALCLCRRRARKGRERARSLPRRRAPGRHDWLPPSHVQAFA